MKKTHTPEFASKSEMRRAAVQSPVTMAAAFDSMKQDRDRLREVNAELMYFVAKVSRSACLDQVTGDTCHCFACDANRLLAKANHD